MNEDKDTGLDDLFKKKLEDPVDQIGYKEEDWNALEQMLDKEKKNKGIVFWLPIISSVAALLLLFLGWWNFRAQVNHHNSKNRLQAANHQQANNGTRGGSNQQPANQRQTQPNSVNYAVSPGINNGGKTGKSSFIRSVVGSGHDTTSHPQNELPNRQPMETLTAASHLQISGPASPDVLPVSAIDIAKPTIIASAPNGNKIKIKSQSAYRPQFAMSVLAAPDVNGVGSFQQTKVGTNVGLLFSAGVFKKLTLSTGVLYSVKPYITPFENYHTQYQFPTNPVNVTADCRMLDIPINVGYQLYNKHQNKISIGTGLSSYIMLHENYTFNYANPYATGPSGFNVPGVNKYFFGVLNLNATYQHQINSKVGISFQPYLKLPLTNLGYSQVRLQTTGVAVGLSWNLNSLSKR